MSKTGEPRAAAKRLAIDAAAGVGLVVAVAAVFLLRARSTSSDTTTALAETSQLETIEATSGGEPEHPRPLRLAVTEPVYDDMGKLLDQLGPGYRYTTIPLEAVLDPNQLGRYDVVFLTCGGVPRSWTARRARGSQPAVAGLFRARREIAEQLRRSLRRFVGHGGTLYVSDLHFKLLAVAFPELVDWQKVAQGEIQTIDARVVDEGLGRRLGSSIRLRFDMRAWRPAAFHGPDVTVYLEGDIQTIRRGRMTVPLLIGFPFQEGSVIFTSFHNEAQQTDTELELLRHLVFTTVTAREEARIKQTMVRGGISPRYRDLLSTGGGGRPVQATYHCDGGRLLQFVLGFRDQGARLQLTVVDPRGRRYEKTGRRTFTIEIPEPPAGPWQYTITPLEVPYRNFPFTLTIGQRQ